VAGALLTTGEQARITLWNLKTGERMSRPMNARGTLNQMALAPDGRTLATVGLSPYVRIWDIRQDALLRRVCEIANRELTAVERKEFGISEIGRPLCDPTAMQ
jgi:WD40 repeat protein